MSKTKTPGEVLAFAEQNGCRLVDLKFVDLLGQWQRFAVPLSRLTEKRFEEGFGFDDASPRGEPPGAAGGLRVVPDAVTAVLDPFYTTAPTLSLVCDLVDPATGTGDRLDPRHIARKAQAFLQHAGLADTARFGPEVEFFIFDDVRFDLTANAGFYAVDSDEGIWNSGRGGEVPNLGHRPRHRGGHAAAAPTDQLADLRQIIVQTLESVGLQVERERHGVATAGQAAVTLGHRPLVEMADQLMWLKYIAKNVARLHGKTATFMPRPLHGDAGSGLHVHQSLWKDGRPLFAGEGAGGLSDLARYYVGGLLEHARALSAFTNPTTNSYRRLATGLEAPVRLSAASKRPEARRVELRTPDPSCNGYLAFAALLMAGLDGIERRLDPGEALDRDLASLGKPAEVPSTPGSLEEALAALRADHAFLLRGEVFTEEVVDRWIELKTARELDFVRTRPVPAEFMLYYDV